jgi:hypothetical protein
MFTKIRQMMAEDKAPLVHPAQEGIECLEAQVGRQRGGVGPQIVEDRAGVPARGVADVSPLGIEDDGDIRPDRVARAPQGVPARAAQRLEERQVQLVGRGQVARRLDDGREEGSHLAAAAHRQSGRLGVQADAQGRAGPRGCAIPLLKERHASPPHLNYEL